MRGESPSVTILRMLARLCSAGRMSRAALADEFELDVRTMRRYLARLDESGWTVEVVGRGAEAVVVLTGRPDRTPVRRAPLAPEEVDERIAVLERRLAAEADANRRLIGINRRRAERLRILRRAGARAGVDGGVS